MTMPPKLPAPSERLNSVKCVGDVFLSFLILGLTAFGGPVAHIGYFRRTFVARKAWVTEAVFAELVAVAQALPGPASSQVGFALGLQRAGLWGGLAAWLGFTLPSAVLMILAARWEPFAVTTWLGAAVQHGLHLCAVAIVAQAVLAMMRALTPDKIRAAIALAGLTGALLLPPGFGQITILVAGGLLGVAFCHALPAEIRDEQIPLAKGWTPWALGAFGLLFLPGGVIFSQMGGWALFHRFYQTGALVFGGGHVVLPLLQSQVVTPGWVSPARFLSGYGAAQALPGPLFSFAAFLGASAPVGGGGWRGGVIALVAIFLPGLLLMAAAAPYWRKLQGGARTRASLQGVNAAVVGLLAAALYNPVCTTAIHSARDTGLALAAFLALVKFKAPPLAMVCAMVFASAVSAALAP